MEIFQGLFCIAVVLLIYYKRKKLKLVMIAVLDTLYYDQNKDSDEHIGFLDYDDEDSPCPSCHSTKHWEQKPPYCSNCGWGDVDG